MFENLTQIVLQTAHIDPETFYIIAKNKSFHVLNL